MEGEDKSKKKRLAGLLVKLTLLTFRASTWALAILLTRVLKQCDQKQSSKPAPDNVEITLSHREEFEPAKENRSVGR